MTTPRLLVDGLLRAAAATPDKAAIIAGAETCTYEQLGDRAARLAAYLVARGVAPGDRVAVYLDNGWQCAAAVYGVLLAGGVFVVINPQTKTDKLHFMLADCGAVGLITDRHLARQYEPAVADLPALRTIMSFGTGAATGEQPLVVDAGRVLADEAPLTRPVPREPADLAALIYTSGSTGEPKGVMQSQGSMVFAAHSIIEYLQLATEDRILVVLPMAFDYGLYQLLMSVFKGATLVVERSFAFPGQIYEVMKQQRVTVVPGVPTVFATMQASLRKAALEFPDVRLVTNTAAALYPSLLPALGELFPNARICKMYGLTECKRVSYLDPDLLADHPSSVGVAIPGTWVSLHNADGSPTRPGEPGILHVHGPHIMIGYWNRPEATARMLRIDAETGERVLVAQDLFTQDEDGLLYFVGRSDDIIKTRGEKVSPVEVENVLCRLDAVAEAAVIGLPDEHLGEQIRAYVVRSAGAELTEAALRRHCAAHLENFMVPQSIVFVEALPRTGNNKIDKKLLVAWSNEDG